MEKWDIYDYQRTRTGKVVARHDVLAGATLAKGEYRLVCYIVVFNSNDEILIHQRCLDKQGWAGYWDLTAAGSALAGENSQQAAARELFEEVGITADFDKSLPHFTVNSLNIFNDFYLLRQDVDLTTLNVPNDEVAQVRWADKNEILAMIADGSFVPIRRGTLELAYDLIKRRRTLERDET